ncbi:Rhs element Vgr protein [Leptolyngbya sp. NIES-3755]|nr:Rhs element Vgr protein [Leptolyngbya sp. NIES-3755]
MPSYFGKYRGKVTVNKDPLQLGRVQVTVPAVYGTGATSWAMPCTPYAGKDIGFFTIPPVGSNIWVEFEAGDPDYPIWAGCFWGTDELPADAKVDDPDKVQVFRTPYGITLTLSNLGDNKGLTLIVESPTVERTLKMVFNADGIELNNKDETTIKIKADIIELKNRANSTITITQNNIESKQTSVKTDITSSTIDLICNPATIKLSASSGIELDNVPANAKLNSSGIEMSATVPQVKITPAQIELSNTAANVKLLPIAVNVNNGALEVI